MVRRGIPALPGPWHPKDSAIVAPLTRERVSQSLIQNQQPTPRRSRRRWSGSLSCSSPWKFASRSSSFTAESACSVTQNVHVMALLAPYLCYRPARPRSPTPSRSARQGPRLSDDRAIGPWPLNLLTRRVARRTLQHRVIRQSTRCLEQDGRHPGPGRSTMEVIEAHDSRRALPSCRCGWT